LAAKTSVSNGVVLRIRAETPWFHVVHPYGNLPRVVKRVEEVGVRILYPQKAVRSVTPLKSRELSRTPRSSGSPVLVSAMLYVLFVVIEEQFTSSAVRLEPKLGVFLQLLHADLSCQGRSLKTPCAVDVS